MSIIIFPTPLERDSLSVYKAALSKVIARQIKVQVRILSTSNRIIQHHLMQRLIHLTKDEVFIENMIETEMDKVAQL